MSIACAMSLFSIIVILKLILLYQHENLSGCQLSTILALFSICIFFHRYICNLSGGALNKARKKGQLNCSISYNEQKVFFSVIFPSKKMVALVRFVIN